MARRDLRPLCLLALLALLAIPARAYHDCDRLASHPEDPGRVAPPTEFRVLDADLAIWACQKALAEDPTNGRWMTQLGRAYNKNQDYEKSLAWTRKGAEAGYPFALHAMSLHYHYGEGVPKDLDAQVHWLQKARAAKVPISSQRLASLGLEDLGHPYLDPGQASELLREAGDDPSVSGLWGDLHFAMALRVLYGKDPTQDPRYQAGQVPLEYHVRAGTHGASRAEYLARAAAAVRHYEHFLGLSPGQAVAEAEPHLARKRRLLAMRKQVLGLPPR